MPQLGFWTVVGFVLVILASILFNMFAVNKDTNKYILFLLVTDDRGCNGLAIVYVYNGCIMLICMTQLRVNKASLSEVVQISASVTRGS